MQQRQKPKKQTPLWYIGAAAIYLFKFVKFGKVGTAFLTMLLSIGAYALLFPWQFAVGFVILIFIHELGHVVASRIKGMPVTAIVFIPFLGAATSMKRHPRDASTEAFISLGGPVLGTIGALLFYFSAQQMGSALLYSLAYVGFFLNLINLLPIYPLDGGKIVPAITRWLWLVGLVGGLVVIYYLKSILFFIIWAMFAYDLYKKFVGKRKAAETRVMNASFQVAAEPLIEQGYLIPGPEHKRDLPFLTYSDLEGQQHVKVYWEGLDFTGTIPMMEQGLIKRTHVTRLERQQKEDGLYLMIHCQVEYTKFENDAYYDVPASARWAYGAAYLLLAAFLFVMMREVHEVPGLNLRR
ncbi:MULTISPECIES: site-2 protease family protein [Paenibacillus]|uniref:site-2 protease family protein n=1 Tax=Paenibacillus TaxID=44249 RepID=UPI0022B906B8|nr:site-2 protease family protein [Paenibacillus caseinilyticus]MCZ8519373.1 site-2 protease family protein [Paenibacillus caseinilyticus]